MDTWSEGRPRPQGGRGEQCGARGGRSCWQRVGIGWGPDRREPSESQGFKLGDSAQGYLLSVLREAHCSFTPVLPSCQGKEGQALQQPREVWWGVGRDPAGPVPRGLGGSRGPRGAGSVVTTQQQGLDLIRDKNRRGKHQEVWEETGGPSCWWEAISVLT